MKQREVIDRDDSPLPGMSGLRDVVPPPSLVPAVMRKISEPQPFSLWAWLRRPRRFELRVTPMGLVAVAGVAAAIFVVVPMVKAPRGRALSVVAQAEAPAAVASAQNLVQVRFVLVAKGAKKVAVAGDFNDWNAGGVELEDVDGKGTFVATVPLARGQHEYMFLVDGEWVSDPAAAETRPDGFGRNNALMRL